MPKSLTIDYYSGKSESVPYTYEGFRALFRSARVSRISTDAGEVLLDHPFGEEPLVSQLIFDLR